MSRKNILNKIIKMEGNFQYLIKQLGSFGWDSEEELITLKAEDLIRILKYFINGKLEDTDVEEWANLLEGRDDVGFDLPLIKKILEELANPYLSEQLTMSRAEVLIKQLSKRNQRLI